MSTFMTVIIVIYQSYFFLEWQKWGSMSIWYYCMFETNTLVLISNVCPCFNEWYCSVECKRLMLLCVSVVISMMMMICSEHKHMGITALHFQHINSRLCFLWDYYPLERCFSLQDTQSHFCIFFFACIVSWSSITARDT